jgi:hypothetical protein
VRCAPADEPGWPAAILKADRSGPILLLNDISAAEAPDRLASLPCVEHDLVMFDYIELEDTSPA